MIPSTFYLRSKEMPMLMLKWCNTCGELFPGIYVPEGSSDDFKSAATSADTLHMCSRGHKKGYICYIRLYGLVIDFFEYQSGFCVLTYTFFATNFSAENKREKKLILKELDVSICL